MLQSKACCHLEDEQEWSWTREKQLEKIKEYEIKMDKILQKLRGTVNEKKEVLGFNRYYHHAYDGGTLVVFEKLIS